MLPKQRRAATTQAQKAKTSRARGSSAPATAPTQTSGPNKEQEEGEEPSSSDSDSDSSEDPSPEPIPLLSKYLAAHPDAPKLAKRAHRFATDARTARNMHKGTQGRRLKAKQDSKDKDNDNKTREARRARRERRRRTDRAREARARNAERDLGWKFPYFGYPPQLGPSALAADEFDTSAAVQALEAEIEAEAVAAEERGDGLVVWLARAQPGSDDDTNGWAWPRNERDREAREEAREKAAGTRTRKNGAGTAWVTERKGGKASGNASENSRGNSSGKRMSNGRYEEVGEDAEDPGDNLVQDTDERRGETRDEEAGEDEAQPIEDKARAPRKRREPPQAQANSDPDLDASLLSCSAVTGPETQEVMFERMAAAGMIAGKTEEPGMNTRRSSRVKAST